MIGILAIVAVVGIGLLIAILVLSSYLFPVATISPDANITMIGYTYHVPLAVASAYYAESTQQMDYYMERCIDNKTGAVVYAIDGYSPPSYDYTYFDITGSMLCKGGGGGGHADQNLGTEGTCPQTAKCTDIVYGGRGIQNAS